MLLSIDADICSLTLEGPDYAHRWTSRTQPTQPTLTVRAGGQNEIQGVSWGPDEDEQSGGPLQQYDGPGPALMEESSYKLTIVSRTGKRLRLVHRDPNLISDVRPIRGEAQILTGSLNFRSQVGYSVFKIIGDGGELTFAVEVRPTKLDYEADYSDLVEGVSGLSRQLVLEYLRATFQGGDAEQVDSNKRIDWLLLLRQEIGQLERSLTYLASRPHIQLVREVQTIKAEKIRRPSSITRRAIERGHGEGTWIESSFGRHRSSLPNLVAVETLDSPEHRWLRQQLIEVTRALAVVRSGLASVASVDDPAKRIETKRTRAISRELLEMEETLAPFLQVEPLSAARGYPPPGFGSLVLSGRPGYREAYQSLLRLRMSTLVGGAALELPLKDLSELYEIWCFLAVLSIVSELTGSQVDVHSLVDVEDRGTRLRVVPGKSTEVTLKSGSTTVKVAYNREYRMLTGGQRPDVIVEVLRPGVPPMVLVLDAKYRLDTSREYLRNFDRPGPPIDAIGQLHRYRDAIVMSAGEYGRGRPVVRAVALFPLSDQDNVDWLDHKLFESIDELGVGGLPFLPSNTEWVRAWLEYGLNAPTPILAWPGQPFLAWESVTRQ